MRPASDAAHGLPPLPYAPIQRLTGPFQRFLAVEAASGIVLIACTALALLAANSGLASAWSGFWSTPVSVGVGSASLSYPLWYWVNDGLMAIFFFVVGLEIKREVIAGELASPRKAALPIAAAIGGMVAPALIYASMTFGTASISGWGIPMATDIAFALGVLALLGDRINVGLKIFLTALAIIDDLGAVLVIAIFYTDTIAWSSLAIGGGALVLLAIANLAGVRKTLVYGLVGIVVWVAFLKSGVHATIAGVLLAMTIPSRTRIHTADFLVRGRALLDVLEKCLDTEEDADAIRHGAVEELEVTCEQAQTPLHRLEHGLHVWVAFLIMPVFALANAGVSLAGGIGSVLFDRVTIGVFLGLVFGKQIGVMLASWITVRLNLASLPTGTTWRQLYGVSWLAAIGFTMSLFIASLAFDDATSLAAAKVGVLGASLVAGIVGFALLRWKS